ncbi:hypothetical protein P8C59_003076 [Phyllachora maydis]|uniref:Integrase catalytic domain-containing protein n=1 Tax=Phyllachora maydis TaxID=1825666 RepID=A0AAD9I0Q4_9PEZI|nr:hypothetical protein P8C59_003076 [Phyllachora maydis]
MADQAKGKGIASKRASNPADPGDIKTLLLSLNTLKASVDDSVSAIKNISSTLASLTNSSNAAATGKTSYSPRFDPFSGTMDLDSPLRPPRKEPYLGPAVNSATSNLDPPIDIGSKEGFKDTITSSIVKELSKKAYTIPDDKSKKEDVYNEFHALTFSTYKKGLSAFNAEFNGYLAKLTIAKIDIDPSLILNQYFKALESKFPSWVSRQKSSIRQARMLGLIVSSLNIEYLMADILEESRNPALEAYRAAYIANSSNSTPNSNSNPSKKGKNKKKGKKKASYNVKGQNYSAKSTEQASFMLGSYNLAIEKKRNPTLVPILRNKIVVEIPSNSIRKEDYRPIIEDAIVSEAIEPNKRYKLRNSPAKGTTLEGAPYQSLYKTREPKPLTGTRDLPHMLREPVIEGNIVEKAISSPTLKEPNIGHIGLYLLKKTSSITKGLPNFDKIKEANFHCSSYLIEGDTIKIRPRPYNRNPIVLLLVNYKSRYRWVFNLPNKSSPIVAKAIKGFFRGLRNGFGKYPTKFHFDRGTEITDLLTTWLAKRGIKFSTSAPYIHKQNGLVEQSVRVILDSLEGELVDLDLDLEGAFSLDPSNLNTEKPISIEIGPSKLEPYESSSNSELDKPLPDKPMNPVIVESTRPTISIRKPELLEAFPQTIKPIFTPKPIEVIAPNQPITNEPLDNSNLILKGDKMQLDYYKLLAKTSSYILSFIYKARKRVISKDSTPTTYKQVLKLPRDERSKWLEAITKEFIQLLELGVFKFLPRSLLPSNLARGFMQVEGLDYTVTYASTSIPPTWRILLATGAVLDWEIEQADFIGAFLNSALREEIYMEIPKGLLEAASNKAIYKLLLKYSYNPSTPNIIKLSKALYSLKQSPREWQDKLKILLKSLGYLPLISDPGVFYNAKTCHFIVTYIDDCLFIGPDMGYITDLKKRLNKVYAIEDLGPAAYFLGYVEEAVSRFNLADSKPISIPL